MRAVLQRVSRATVTIDKREEGSIGQGLLILAGIEEGDTTDDITWLAGKILRMRIFDDREGVMNLSVCDIDGEILLVSQFTLHASTKKGNRPSYLRAARPEMAIPLYEALIRELENGLEKPLQTGRFGAMMEVALVNSGPVTILIDSKNRE